LGVVGVHVVDGSKSGFGGVGQRVDERFHLGPLSSVPDRLTEFPDMRDVHPEQELLFGGRDLVWVRIVATSDQESVGEQEIIQRT
jgi:hypothetical protein